MEGYPGLQVEQMGSGRPVLVLHGGGGPATVVGMARHMAEAATVLMPTHPGWNGTPRPATIRSVSDLAALYRRMLAERGLRDVAIVGSSMGGWIALEMATADNDGTVGQVVVVDGVGVEVEDAPMADFFSLGPRGIAEHAYHEPEKFFVDPTTLPPDRLAMLRDNMATLRAVAGERMFDPTLLGRLSAISTPVLVVWGESDRIATPAYGRRLAAAIPGARFELVARAGHLPQLERPEATFRVIDAFVGGPSIAT